MNPNFNFLGLIIIIIIVVFSISLHELAHGLVAYWLGDRTAKDAGRLTLNPIVNIDPYMSILVPVVLYILGGPVFGGAKPVPVNFSNLKWREWGMALVALAGPFTNFLLSLIFFLIGHFTGWIYGTGGEIAETIFTQFVFTNLGFMIFNLIPIPPLDGSRVLYAISPDGVRKMLNYLEVYGIIIVYGLVLLFGQFFSSIMVDGMNAVLSFFYWIVGVQ